MKDNSTLGVLLVAFVAVILGITFVEIVANQTTLVTQANTVTNEQITLINATPVSLANRQLDSVTSVVNATNASQTLTLNTNYTVNLPQGTITSLARGGLWNVTYVYRDIGDSTSRTVISLVVLFLALATLLGLLYYLSPSFREWIGM